MADLRLIGGYKLYGGWIMQADPLAPLHGPPPYAFLDYPGRRIPIRHCRFNEQFHERPLYISGLLGKPTARRVSVQSEFAFSIWVDADNILEVSSTYPPVPGFRQRDPFQLVFLAGYDYSTQVYARAYYAPRCTAETVTPIWDSESQPKKMIGMEVTGRSRAHDFILPDDGDPEDGGVTLVGAYVQYLKTGGNLV